MIAFLEGKVQYYNQDFTIVRVHDIGYKVFPAKSLQSVIRKLNQPIKLYTYTHVRDDILDLYGFTKLDDLLLFEQLLTVSGIGPKTALGIFQKGDSQDITNAILNADLDFFEGIARLGRKNAQKIIIELKNKVGSEKELDLLGKGGKEIKELVEALKTFGFSTKESLEAIKSISDKDASVNQKIRLALKYLGK